VRAKRATYDCCFICRRWGRGFIEIKGCHLCLDCENDVISQRPFGGRKALGIESRAQGAARQEVLREGPDKPVDPQQLSFPGC